MPNGRPEAEPTTDIVVAFLDNEEMERPPRTKISRVTLFTGNFEI